MKVLVFNAGSSTYKVALYDIEGGVLWQPKEPLWSLTLEENDDLEGQIQKRMEGMPPLDRIVHRVVHGGDKFVKPTIITTKVKEEILALIPLAPLHNPASLQGIELLEKMFPGIPQIAIFDTAFHATLTEEVRCYPGPYSWYEMGIKRYGFHGINYQYCTARVSHLLNSENLKIVCCHLGNGASMAAISEGRSVDTTMGFTPLDGLMMGSRSGAIDPGIITYLEQFHKQTPEQISTVLNQQSGLQGISGQTHDMRMIHALIEQGDKRALLAYKMYVHSVKRYLGAMMGVLEGVDAIVFTAGIGEHDAALRSEACKALRFAGIKIDERKNRECHGDAIISTNDSKAVVLVIAAQEDWCMAIQSQCT